MDSRHMFTEEVAEKFGVKPLTIRRWISEGRLPACKPGKRFMVKASDVEALLERRRYQPPTTKQAAAPTV